MKSEVLPQSKNIEIFPYAMVMAPDESRPILIFKDKEEEITLPVWLSAIDAGIAIHEKSFEEPSSSPHGLSWSLLKKLGIQLDKCVFKEIRGHHQFLSLHFSGDERVQTIEARADKCLSFCLSVKTRFFCTKKYAWECRMMDAEIKKNQLHKIQIPQSVTIN